MLIVLLLLIILLPGMYSCPGYDCGLPRPFTSRAGGAVCSCIGMLVNCGACSWLVVLAAPIEHKNVALQKNLFQFVSKIFIKTIKNTKA